VMETPTSVSLVKESRGLYRLRANCAVTLSAPSPKTLVGVKQDGRMSVGPAPQHKGTFTVDAEQLREGEIYIIMPGADGGYDLKFWKP